VVAVVVGLHLHEHGLEGGPLGVKIRAGRPGDIRGVEAWREQIFAQVGRGGSNAGHGEAISDRTSI
jgi:hypothetical protein